MPSDLLYKPATELKALIAAKEVSPVEIVDAAIARLHETEPKLNSFIALTEDVARDAARTAEAAVVKGGPLGLLHGLPISVKDLIAMRGVKLTSGSRTGAGTAVAVDAPCVERVRAQGACILGKTTTSEFGCKAVGDSPLSGITRNPWNTDKTPGASSAGAAASVAAGVTPFALGTDGGGSVRIPGAFTGLFAIKPQFARIPVYPPSATTNLSHVGPMSRTVRDAALLLQATAGFDARDAFAVAGGLPDFVAACDGPVEGLRIAWSPTLGYANPDPEVLELCERAAKRFEEFGCIVELVETVMEEDPEDIWRAAFYAGAGAGQRQALEDTPELLDPAVRAAFARALAQPLPDYCEMVFRRNALREHMRAFFERYDLLLSPTLPVPPFDVGLNAPPRDPDADIVGWVRYTYPFNLTGTPAASIPAGFTRNGLPVGLQIAAGVLREDIVFAAAATFEEACPWADRTPEI